MRAQLPAAALTTLGVSLLAAATFPVGDRPVVAAAAPISAESTTEVARPTGSRPVPIEEPMQIGGHRAGIDRAPENTMAAVRQAVAGGADTVELDVRYTADGRPVILHDSTLDRTTECTGAVAERTWAQVAGCDAGSWFRPTFLGEPLPDLDAALATLSRTGLVTYLHVKLVETTAQAASLLDAVTRHGMTDGQVLFLADRSYWLERLHRAGVPREHLGRVFNSADGWSEQRHWKTIVPYDVPITRELVGAAHARGQRVVVVEDHPLALADLSGLGVDGYLADRLAAALSWGNR